MIEAKHVLAMIEHWLYTPPNGYFGSSYGADLKRLLMNPMSTPIADSFVAKLKQDVPLLNDLDISVLSENLSFERKRIFLSVGTSGLIDISAIQQVHTISYNPNEEYFDADAS